MDERKKAGDLSVEELKKIIRDALAEALGVRGVKQASGEEEKDFLEEEFRLNLMDEDEGGVA